LPSFAPCDLKKSVADPQLRLLRHTRPRSPRVI